MCHTRRDVDLSPLIDQTLNIRGVEFINCKGWMPSEPAVTLKDILQQADALFEEQITTDAQRLEIWLSIYDSLNTVLDNVNTYLMNQMDYGNVDSMYRMSYI